jgi:cysteinyl-tRNA synthetase
MTKLAKSAQQLADKSSSLAELNSVDFGPFQSAWNTLHDDLNTPGALGGLFTGMRDAAKLEGEDAAKALAALNRILRALGITLPDVSQSIVDIPAEVKTLAEERWAARTAKNWALSDVLRDQLATAGWIVKDNKDDYELIPK